MTNTFCWVCSKRNASLTCSKCVRCYHKKCIVQACSDDEFICFECNNQEGDDKYE